MLLIIAEVSPKNGVFSLKKAFQLAAIICNKKNIAFVVEEDKDAVASFAGKGFKYYINPERRKLFKEKISAILFFKDKLSSKDKKTLSLAGKKNIPAIKFSYMGENPVECNAIIDPSPASYITSDGDKKILSGPEYAVLHNKYIHFHDLNRKYNKTLRNILLSVGDEFPYRELKKLTETLLNHGFKVKIIPGKNFKRFNRKTLKRIYPKIQISGTPESYARSYFESDLAIIDPEHSAIRASAVGTPAIYLPQNTTGNTTASYFEEKGAGVIFRRWKKEDYSEMIELLKFFSLDKRSEIGSTAKTLVDGKGVYRIAEVIKSLLNS